MADGEQTTASVCEGLDEAWRFFGGVVSRIIPDNASSMVSRADPRSPRIVDAFADYVQARGLFIDAARVASPQDKGRVENQMPYVRESWFDGETFPDLEAARRSASHWCLEIAGARTHGTTHQVPREVFASEELPLLRSAPSEHYDVPHWGEAKVHPTTTCRCSSRSTRYRRDYIGKHVRVRADRRTVRIYLGTELFKTHPRVAVGKRSTDPNDYPVGTAGYAMRSLDALLSRAKDRGEHVGLFAQRLLGGPLPWTKMRQGYELLRLCDRYGEARVDAQCKAALDFDVIDVPKIGRRLKLAIACHPSGVTAGYWDTIASQRSY